VVGKDGRLYPKRNIDAAIARENQKAEEARQRELEKENKKRVQAEKQQIENRNSAINNYLKTYDGQIAYFQASDNPENFVPIASITNIYGYHENITGKELTEIMKKNWKFLENYYNAYIPKYKESLLEKLQQPPLQGDLIQSSQLNVPVNDDTGIKLKIDAKDTGTSKDEVLQFNIPGGKFNINDLATDERIEPTGSPALQVLKIIESILTSNEHSEPPLPKIKTAKHVWKVLSVRCNSDSITEINLVVQNEDDDGIGIKVSFATSPTDVDRIIKFEQTYTDNVIDDFNFNIVATNVQ
jgi:hypothetical protein